MKDNSEGLKFLAIVLLTIFLVWSSGSYWWVLLGLILINDYIKQ